MSKLYVSFKTKVRSIIDKHFPSHIAKRFTLRSDSEIWIPKMDEYIWLKNKNNIESIHILFDGLEIFEIPHDLDPRFAELYFLKAFKQALKDGKISIQKVKEWTDNKTARRNKKEKQKKKHKKLKESFEYAKQHPFTVREIEAKLPKIGKKTILKTEGGENNGKSSPTDRVSGKIR